MNALPSQRWPEPDDDLSELEQQRAELLYGDVARQVCSDEYDANAARIRDDVVDLDGDDLVELLGVAANSTPAVDALIGERVRRLVAKVREAYVEKHWRAEALRIQEREDD